MQDSNPFVNFRNGAGANHSSRRSTTSDSVYVSPTPLILPPSPGEVLKCERRQHSSVRYDSGYDADSRTTPRSPFAGPTNPWQLPSSGSSLPPNTSARPLTTSQGYAALHATATSIAAEDSGEDEENERDLQARAQVLNPRPGRQGQEYERLKAQVLPNVQLVKGSDLSKLNLVGRGSFGEVWECSWMGVRVAAKYLLQHKPDPTMIREVEMLHNLTHPSVIRLLGMCMEPPIILTQFCSRGSLYSCIRAARNDDKFKKKKLSWLCSLRMLEDVASGMMFLHSQNTLHGDLRSPNILLERDYTARIADFGLAKVMQSTAGEPVSKTTNPRWLAPEVYKSNTLTKEGDVYSFGIIMLEMLTWTEPYADMNDAQVSVGLTSEPPIQPEVPLMSIPQRKYTFTEKYMDLMRSCWKAPAQRPTFAHLRRRLACMRRWTMLVQDIPRLSFVRQAVVIKRWQSVIKQVNNQPQPFAFKLHQSTAPIPRAAPHTTHAPCASWSTLSSTSTHTGDDLTPPPRPLYDPYAAWRNSRTSSDSQPVTPTRGFSSVVQSPHTTASPPSSPMVCMRYPDLDAALNFAPLKQTDSEERHDSFMQLGRMLDTLLSQDVNELDPQEVHDTMDAGLQAAVVGSDLVYLVKEREDAHTPVAQEVVDHQLQAWNSDVLQCASGQLPTVTTSIPAAKQVTHPNECRADGHRVEVVNVDAQDKSPTAVQAAGHIAVQATVRTAGHTAVQAAGHTAVQTAVQAAVPTAVQKANSMSQPSSVSVGAGAPVQQSSMDGSASFSSGDGSGGDDGDGDIPWGPQFMTAGICALAERVLMDMHYPRDQQQELMKQLVDIAMEHTGTHESALMVMCQLAALDAGDGMVKTRMVHEGVLAACCNTLQRLRFYPPSSYTPTCPLACCMSILEALWPVADPQRQETSLTNLLNMLTAPPYLDPTLPQPLVATQRSLVLEAASVQLLLRLRLHHTPPPQLNILSVLKTHGIHSALDLLLSLPAGTEQWLEERTLRLLTEWARVAELAVVIEGEITEALGAGRTSVPSAADARLMRLLSGSREQGAAGHQSGNLSIDSSTSANSQHWSAPSAVPPANPHRLTSPYITAQPPQGPADLHWPWAAVTTTSSNHSTETAPAPSAHHHADSSWHSSSTSTLPYAALQDLSTSHTSHTLSIDSHEAKTSINSTSTGEHLSTSGSGCIIPDSRHWTGGGTSNTQIQPASTAAHGWQANPLSPTGASVRPANHAVLDLATTTTAQQSQSYTQNGLIPWSDPPHHPVVQGAVTHHHPYAVDDANGSWYPQDSVHPPSHTGPPAPQWHSSLFNSIAPHAAIPESTYLGPPPPYYPLPEYSDAWYAMVNSYPTPFQPPFHVANAHAAAWCDPSRLPGHHSPHDYWMSPDTGNSHHSFSAAVPAPQLQLPAPQASPTSRITSGPGRPPLLLTDHTLSHSEQPLDPPLSPSTAPASKTHAGKLPVCGQRQPGHSGVHEAWRIAASSDTQPLRDQDVHVAAEQLPSRGDILTPQTAAPLESCPDNGASRLDAHALETRISATKHDVCAEDVTFTKQHSATLAEADVLRSLSSDASESGHSGSQQQQPHRSGKSRKFMKPGGRNGTPAVDMTCKLPFLR